MDPAPALETDPENFEWRVREAHAIHNELLDTLIAGRTVT